MIRNVEFVRCIAVCSEARVSVYTNGFYIGALEWVFGKLRAIPLLDMDVVLMLEAQALFIAMCSCFVGAGVPSVCDYWHALACIEADADMAHNNDIELPHSEPTIARCGNCIACCDNTGATEFDIAFAANHGCQL